jgi:uncharacterized protein (DUF1501 family)
VKDLAARLAAFHADMHDHIGNLTIVTMSEFGRRALENGSMMVLGGDVHGGRVHGAWPGMREGQLIGPGDLAVTTDYRDVLSEVLVKRLNNTATDKIFPDHSPQVRNILK